MVEALRVMNVGSRVVPYTIPYITPSIPLHKPYNRGAKEESHCDSEFLV